MYNMISVDSVSVQFLHEGQLAKEALYFVHERVGLGHVPDGGLWTHVAVVPRATCTCVGDVIWRLDR